MLNCGRPRCLVVTWLSLPSRLPFPSRALSFLPPHISPHAKKKARPIPPDAVPLLPARPGRQFLSQHTNRPAEMPPAASRPHTHCPRTPHALTAYPLAKCALRARLRLPLACILPPLPPSAHAPWLSTYQAGGCTRTSLLSSSAPAYRSAGKSSKSSSLTPAFIVAPFQVRGDNEGSFLRG